MEVKVKSVGGLGLSLIAKLVGTGLEIDVWRNRLIPNFLALCYLSGDDPGERSSLPMSDPIFEGEWNVERIFSIFTPNVVLAIFKIKIFPMAQPDKIIWTHEKN